MRAVVVTTGLLALLALVAIGSRSEGWRSGESRDISPFTVDIAYTVAILIAIGLVALTVLTIRSAKGKVTLDPPSGLARMVIVFSALTLFAAYGMSRYEFNREREDQEPDEVFGTAGTLTERGDVRDPEPARRPEFQWWLATMVGGGAVLVGVWWYRRSRIRPFVREQETVAEQLTQVLTETLDDLHLERDPRRAVIRAYARMEQVLAHHGLPRAPHEAPLEYLARVLRELQVGAEAAHALTELFERAKFSQHEIDVAMKEEAIEALVRVRDDLEAAA